ncbi:hypothetical protein BOX15_Mlig032261g4, partial [Macrostomum lignano]
ASIMSDDEDNDALDEPHRDDNDGGSVGGGDHLADDDIGGAGDGTGGVEILTSGGAAGAGGPVAPHERVTSIYMTKYERARVLGARAQQISLCAPVMVELEGETDPLKIAEKELKARKIPFIIRRYLPDGSYENWKVQDLIVEGT